jgi:diguanylate cyclase (GGDEF)-like protein/PAS domain S-box-containing protein
MPRPSTLSVACAVLTALVLSALGVAFWHSRVQANDLQTQRNIETKNQELAAAVMGKLRSYELVLRGVKGFVEGSTEITATEFSAFALSQAIDRTAVGLQGIALALHVPETGKAALELRQRATLDPAFTVRPAGTRAAYAPIVFIEPLTAVNRSALGLDLYQVERARAALEASRDTAQPMLSGVLTLAQDGDNSRTASFVMYLPIYRDARPGDPASMEARRALIVGWADGPFRLRDMLLPLATSVTPGVRVQVFQGNSTRAEDLLFAMLDGQETTYASPDEERFTARGQIEFGGQTWTLATDATPAYVARQVNRENHLFVVLSVLASMAAGWIVWLMMSAHQRVQAAATRMTAEVRALSDDMDGTLSAIPDLLFDIDLKGHLHACRTNTPELLPVLPQQLVGQTVQSALPPDASRAIMAALHEAQARGHSVGQQLALDVRGQRLWFELSVARKAMRGDGEPRFIALARDITERRRSEERVHQLAYYDPLTQLPNRSLFMQFTRSALAAANARQLGAAIMIDLDNFKDLNDNWGHRNGDVMLFDVAQRILGCVPPEALVARLGGDEFMVVLRDLGADSVGAAERAEQVCQQILEALGKPYVIEEREHYTSASLGIALFGAEPLTIDELLSRADSAMYLAKADGRSTHRFFDGELKAMLAHRSALEHDLRHSLERGQMHLVYQPQVNAAGLVLGAEALIRWQHPIHGLVSPAQFIPLAEKSGFILRIGEWVLRTACEQLAAWARTPGLQDLAVAINVSARQFRHPDFVAQVLQAIDQTGANPQRLKIEMTESMLADDLDDVVNKMTALKSQGVMFSLDDFGTGYSSLRYLKRLPLDQLKIDQSFVRDVMEDTNDADIVRTVIALGERLNLHVIAEGVETEAQRAFLAENHCYSYQGYLFSRPLDALALAKFVQARRTETV